MFRSAPTVMAMRARPANAVTMPINCRAPGMSRKNTALSSTVKNAWICWLTDASPGGIPWVNARNSSRN